MRIKTYFSGTVEAAIALASRELGGDALLLTARPSGESAKHLGGYEVVFGIPGPAPPQRSLRAFLEDQDCHPAIVERVLCALEGSDAADNDVWAALRDCLRFRPWEPGEDCRLAFVGPAGGGKTTTALKIALQTRNAHLVDADTNRIGSPLARAAAIAGMSCTPALVPGDLDRFVDDERRPLLIDLGGVTEGGDSGAVQWGDSLRRIPGLTVCLVVPGVFRTADLLLAVKRYSAFAPQRLIFTRLDESSRAGGVLSLAGLSGLPLFAFGTGPRVIADIEPASERRILRVLFEQLEPRHIAAAAGGAR